ncbi:hypothetical protein MMC17_002583 [Xylographa soralifera]|nr:hypothetical protein [Xylographa soralifera]
MQQMRQLATGFFLLFLPFLDLWTSVLTLIPTMEGQHRLKAADVVVSEETMQKEKRKQKSHRSHKKNKNVEKTAELTKKQSAADGQDVNVDKGCPPELLPQEGAIESHDKNSAISRSITLPTKTKGKRSNKKKQKTQSAKILGKPLEPATEQTRPNNGEPKNSIMNPVSGGVEPSTSCETTARIELVRPSQGTRKQGQHPVMQHPVAEKAGAKPLDLIDIPCHELQGTNLDVAKPPTNKHKRNYRRLNDKQRAQHHVANDTSAKALDVPINQPMSVESFRRQKCRPAQIKDDTNTPGAKKVHWVDDIGVESVERESLSCVPNQGSASLQEHSLEHQMKAKPLHQKTSHLNSLDHPTPKHIALTEVTAPVTVQFVPSFELPRRTSTHKRVSLSDLHDLVIQLANPSPAFPPRRQRSATMPPCLDTSAGMLMSTTVGDNGNDSCLDFSTAMQMLREKYGARKTIALSPSTDQGSYSRGFSGATDSPSCKPFLSSENTSHSAYEISTITTTKAVFEDSNPTTSTTLTEARVEHDVTESQIPAKISANHDTKHIMSDVSMSRVVTSAPLAENFSSRNKPIKSRARTEKPAYIPPHLRSLMKADAVDSKQQDLEDFHVKTEKVSQDTSNHNVLTGGITKRIPQGEPTADISQSVSFPEPSPLGVSSATKALDKTPESHIQDNLNTHATSSIAKRSEDEIFVARAPKPKTPRKLIRLEDLLPEHLRNIPKPILMGPQVKRNAEIAAKQVHIDPKVAIAQIVKRNEDYYQPVLEMKATEKLVQELAAGEEIPDDNAELAEDRSSMCSEDSKNITTEVIEARRAGRWRWFNGKVEPSETGHNDETPKKELRHELAAWDGQWLTPPIEWTLRGQFNNNTRKHVQWMENWVLDRVMEALNKPVKLDVTNAGWLSGHSPASGTSKQWQTFPEDCVADHVPLEYGPVDWGQAPTLPPNDPYSQTIERQTQTSLSSAKKFCREHYLEKFSVMKEKLARRVEYAQMKRQAEQSRLERAPKANIYIRPAQLSDIPQIKHLYNHYVLNTVHALELDATDDVEWQNRLQGAEDENLAFLVAVLKAAKKYGPGAREGRRGEKVRRGGFARRNGFTRPENIQRDFASETIVGFSYAEDHAGMHTLFQHTVELQLFVDPNHYMNGIGKTLMDRMMTSLDKGYMMEAATDFVDDGKMCYEVGGAREVHKVLVTVGYHFGEEKEFEWRKSWLEQKWEFDHIGTMNWSTLPSFLKKRTLSMDLQASLPANLQDKLVLINSIVWYKEEPDRIPHREIAIRAREQEEARLAEEAHE